jgi:type IV secretory pathway protease TraF
LLLRLVCVASRFAGDIDRQGVAISRFAQILAMACARIVAADHPLLHYLDSRKFGPVVAEAKTMLPYFRQLIASDSQERRSFV